MDFSASAFFGEGEDEVRVFFGGGFNGAVDGEGDGSAEGLGRGDVAEAPNCFYFFGGKGEGFGDVEVGGESFDARGGFWDFRRCGLWGWRRWWEG